MIYFNHKKCTIQMNPLSLNLFEIEILNDESLYSSVQGFFMPKKAADFRFPPIGSFFVFLILSRFSYSLTFLKISQKSKVAK